MTIHAASTVCSMGPSGTFCTVPHPSRPHAVRPWSVQLGFLHAALGGLIPYMGCHVVVPHSSRGDSHGYGTRMDVVKFK